MRIDEVEGIGAAYGAKLGEVGIGTTDDLIMAAASAAGREKVSGMTGISAEQLLKWVNHVDLMRIEGVGPEYADLLEAAGVDSPAELAQRNAANLARTFQEIDAARPNWVRRVPSEATVAGWIASAAEMAKVVSH